MPDNQKIKHAKGSQIPNVLAPYFSSILRAENDSVAYYVLGQAPKGGTTLRCITINGVNANLGNVDEITRDVAGITDKLDKMASSVEGAVTTPARKAAAFGAGVQSAVSSFMKRDRSADAPFAAGPAGPAEGGEPATGGWSYAAAPAEAPDDADSAAAEPTDTATAGETFCSRRIASRSPAKRFLTTTS